MQQATPSVAALAGRLPAISASSALAARIGFDRRLPFWLASAFGPAVTPATAATTAAMGGERLVFDLAHAHGQISLAVEAAPWPALRLAATLPDPQRAAEVAATLLQSVLASGQALLPELRLIGIRLVQAAEQPAPALLINGIPTALVGMSTDFAETIEANLRRLPTAAAGSFSGLRLPSRLRFFDRSLRWSRLCALGTGDVVLSGLVRRAPGGWPITLVFGTENTMHTQASIELDSNSNQVRVDAPLQHRDGPQAGTPPHPTPAALDELQVPVAFEIDSTLLSLSEIAALGPGSMIELDVALANARVRLISHGQTLGSGQLVAIGEHLGVRIERMGLATGATQGN